MRAFLFSLPSIVAAFFLTGTANAKTLAECRSEYQACYRVCIDHPDIKRVFTCTKGCRANYLACGDTLPITGNLPLSKGDPVKKKQKPEAMR
jgi:hypothetical protein